MTFEPGDTVWIERGFGAEKAEVFTANRDSVAVLVGSLSMGDRFILPVSGVYEEKESVPEE